MAFKMKGSPHKMGTIQGTSSAMKMASAFKQDEKKYMHEDMYEVEEQMSYIQEDLEEDPNNKELLKKLKELTKKRDKIHATLKGGNIKPGYDEKGERDKSKDEPY